MASRTASEELGARRSGRYNDQDLQIAREQGEKALAFELWAYIDSLEAATEKVQDQIQRESRQMIVHDLKRIAGGLRDVQLAPSTRWPNHNTQLLTALRLAALKFWERFDPEDRETAPTNDEVANWLRSNHKVSASTANSMATILRADGLPSGPRPRS